MNPLIKQAIDELNELNGDPTVPKNVKTKINEIIKTLKEENDKSVAVHKALNDLEEASSDLNIEAYTRTQLWDVASILEKSV